VETLKPASKSIPYIQLISDGKGSCGDGYFSIILNCRQSTQIKNHRVKYCPNNKISPWPSSHCEDVLPPVNMFVQAWCVSYDSWLSDSSSIYLRSFVLDLIPTTRRSTKANADRQWKDNDVLKWLQSNFKICPIDSHFQQQKKLFKLDIKKHCTAWNLYNF
jgi:hypothetical protein